MSTENVEVFNRYYGNGVAIQFSIGFPYLKREFVKVYLYKKDTDEEKLLNGDQFSFVNDTTIQYPVLPTDEILKEGDILTIQRETTLGSEFEFDNQRRLFPAEVMNADDLAFQQIQELSREIKRAIRVNPTATETPDELLQTVYDKLDSATEVAGDAINAANQAQVAADNATAAVESAEETLVEVTAYVNAAKTDIADTKDAAIAAVNTVKTEATTSINETKESAISTINSTVAEADTTINQYVEDAEAEVRQIARNEAEAAIANAAQEATDIATANVNSYVDGTVKPSLQTYVDQTQAVANSVATSMEQAALSATAASNYASNASADADNAAESAGLAANSASEAALHNLKNKITNCITEIPQDIKLELNNGVLTLKAGSKVYNGNGLYKTITTDVSNTWAYTGSGFVFVGEDGNLNFSNTGSETVSTLPTPSTSYKIFYNSTDRKCYFDLNNSQMQEVSFPIALFTANNGITSIDQVFNGFGYIGSTIFALPGVKGLIPNGRNADGTLKNIEFTVDKVITRDIGTSIVTDRDLLLNSTYVGFTECTYNSDNNLLYNPDGIAVAAIEAGKLSADGSKITSFNPKLPFRAVDYNGLPSQAGNDGKFLTTDGTTASWADVDGGLEIGDIGFAPLGIDEAQNKRRYLNGQVISQAQFVSFTNKIKSAIELYPSLATSEINWQAEVTNSKLGQCGKFVIDDTLGTIRLPKVVNVQGLQDLALMGSIKTESLPNIKGHFGEAGYGETNNYSGAFYKYGNGGSSGSFNSLHWAWFPGFDASRSSSTYQNNAPVQQEAIQYPYFIQVATGVEESVDVTREIELNNPFSLFDSKWADHELSNASWVKSNGTFYSGATYVTAYNELLTEYNNAASVEKTDGSITYKLTPKGFKIALASQDEAITELYNNTGVAWYYVLDTANTQFKLPHTKWGFVGIRNAVGSYVAESLPNIKGHFGEAGYGETNNYSGAFYKYGTGGSNGSFNSLHWAWFPGFDASRSSSTYKDNAPVQERATEMYLYFYVGETIQDANVIAASQVLTSVANKANADMSNVNPEWASTAGKPSGRYINLTLVASGTQYTAPANGYFNVVLNCGGKWANISTSTGLYNAYGNSNYANANFPVKKGDKITITYESGVTANTFMFIYDEGAK